MTEVAVVFDEKRDELHIRVEIRETESTTPKEKDGATIVSGNINRVLRIAAQLASFSGKEGADA